MPSPAAIQSIITNESARHDAHRRNVLLAPRPKKKTPFLSHVGNDFIIPQPPSLCFPEKIIIVIKKKNSQEIGVPATDTGTTRPRSRGTEHYIASHRRIFSPPPQKGFVLSPQLPFPLPHSNPLGCCLFRYHRGGGGRWNSLAHPQSHTAPRRYTFALTLPPFKPRVADRA